MTDRVPDTFLDALEPATRRAEALQLDCLLRAATGFRPRMWGDSILGYGSYHYIYASGRKGDFLATGFAPRARAFSIYILPGCTDFGPILARLGKHRIGKSCLYVNRLSDVDTEVLAELITSGLRDLDRRWRVQPT